MCALASQRFLKTAACALALLLCAAARADTPAAPLSLQKGDRIVVLGDSITESPTGYVPILQILLEERFPEWNLQVLNAGVSSDTVRRVGERLYRDVLSRMPSLVVVYMGVNDVAAPSPDRFTPPEEYSRKLAEVVRACRENGAQVILCTPAGYGEKTDGTNPNEKRMDEFCERSRQVAAQEETPLVDLRAAFKAHQAAHNPQNLPHGILTYDALHPNFAGNFVIAREILAALGVTDPNGFEDRRAAVEQALNAVGERVTSKTLPPPPLRVACVGDSITYGMGLADRPRQCYPAVLSTRLGSGCDVRNFGVSGRTVLQAPKHPYTSSYWKTEPFAELAKFQPDAILVLLGTNDAWHDDNWALQDTFAADYRALLDHFAAFARKPAVWLCTPPPGFEARPSLAANLDQAAAVIRALAAERSLPLVDLLTPLREKPALFPDKCHPNTDGAAFIADAVYAALKDRAPFAAPAK